MAKRVHAVRGVANDIRLNVLSKRTDSEIARDAVQALENHLLIPGHQITITVREGWASLEKVVGWRLQRKLAESAVRRIGGVVGFINDIVSRPTCSRRGQSVTSVAAETRGPARNPQALKAEAITAVAREDGADRWTLAFDDQRPSP